MSTASTMSVLSGEQTRIAMQNFGRATLADYFGDMVIYRNLEPLDRRLPGLKAAAFKMDIANDRIPRKLEPDYAKAAVWFAKQAQKLRKAGAPLNELLYIGDTIYNDGQAYGNMRLLTEWECSCFIGSEKPDQTPTAEIRDDERIYVANRWSALPEWIQWSFEQGLRVGQRTAVVIDIDKTAIGAKGRNDKVIDAARLEGIFRTMDAVLGVNFSRAEFERQYAELNRARYHELTEDNQDYLAYICLVISAGLIDFDEVVQEVANNSLKNFEQFVRWVDSRMMIRPLSGENVRQVHEAVIGSVRVGDPTPFKRFRRQEFVTTVERMGFLPDTAPVEELLAEEITLTNEVCELAVWLQARGCLILCLSDKPDEASCPDSRISPDLPPLHRAVTHQVGVGIRNALDALTG